jgi:hypothetical protein
VFSERVNLQEACQGGCGKLLPTRVLSFSKRAPAPLRAEVRRLFNLLGELRVKTKEKQGKTGGLTGVQ